jgi:predicted transcriptional regulator
MRSGQQPTEAEYTILQILWQHGGATVRDVHRTLNRSREIGYTSVLKTLQVMTEKGLVVRDEQERAHLYTPTFSEETAQGTILTDLLQRVFGGSAQRLVQRALEVQPATREDLAEIRQLLESMEQGAIKKEAMERSDMERKTTEQDVLEKEE